MLLGNPNIPPYSGYDSSRDASVDFMFNTVALRYGHTQVNNVTARLNEDRSPASGGTILLRNVFFDPTILYTGGCSPIYRGLNSKAHNSPEVNIVDDLKEYLFAKKGSFGLDLLSTNMRRAREAGLPNYNTARQIYNFPPQVSFNYTVWQAEFNLAYGTDDPTNCDPWICCLLEPGINGGELGELNHDIVVRQFSALRAGDRFWYDNLQFNATELAEIKATKLADIIIRNSQVVTLKCNIFEVPGSPYNGIVGPTCPRPTTTGTTGAKLTSSTSGGSTSGTGVTTGAKVTGAASVAGVSVALLFAVVALLLAL